MHVNGALERERGRERERERDPGAILKRFLAFMCGCLCLCSCASSSRCHGLVLDHERSYHLRKKRICVHKGLFYPSSEGFLMSNSNFGRGYMYI